MYQELNSMNSGHLSKKTVPRMEEYEDDGTWVWLSYAPECCLILAHLIGERKQKSADKII